MKYVSIDIETTGLNPVNHNILEFGAVIDDTENLLSLKDLPKFHCYILPPREGYKGDPFALWLNNNILEKIAKKDKYPQYNFLEPSDVGKQFKKFLLENKIEKVKASGKNFATFDKPFIDNLPDFKDLVKFHHRIFDPGSLYFAKSDTEIPDMKKILERMGVRQEFKEVKHTSIEDSEAVIQMIRYALNSFSWDNIPDNWS